MKAQEIEIFPIAHTVVDRTAVQQWLRFIGAGEYDVPWGISDPALLVAMAAKRCYMSFEPGLNPNVTKVRKDLCEYLDNVLASGHGSVLEHATYSFAIEGCTRVFTAEMNRHRAGWAISEGSMRYIRLDDIPFWMPISLRDNPEDDNDTSYKKKKSQDLFREMFFKMEDAYKELCKIWDVDALPFKRKKELTSMFRRIVGMGVSSGGVWTGNLRAIRHVVTLRTEPAAEEEIAYVFKKVLAKIKELTPELFADFSDDGVPKYKKV